MTIFQHTVLKQLDRIETLLLRSLSLEVLLVSIGDDILAGVSEIETVEASMQTLLEQLFAALQGAINTGDMTKVQEAMTRITALKDKMVAATIANTPAAV